MIKILDVNEIQEGESKGFEIENVKLFVVLKDGDYFVYENKCPHLGIDLEYVPNQFLDMDKALIICSTHGALFEIQSGHCVSGPCQGQDLNTIEHKIEQGFIWVNINK